MNAALEPKATGRTTQEWQQADAKHFLHPFTDFAALSRKGSRIITHAQNIYLWDSEGHRILDAMSGLWCVNVGYGQPALIDAATRQLKELPFYNAFFQTATPPAIGSFIASRSVFCKASSPPLSASACSRPGPWQFSQPLCCSLGVASRLK